MLLDILQTGANFFVVIVAVVLAFVIGLTTTDYLKTKAKEKQLEDSEKD